MQRSVSHFSVNAPSDGGSLVLSHGFTLETGVGRHIIPQLAERLCHVTYGGTLLLSARHTRRACVHASDAASTNGVMT